MQSKPQLFQNILPFPVRAWTSIEDPQFEPQPQRTSVGFQRKVCKEGGVKPIASSNLPPSNLSHTLQTYHLHIFPPSNLSHTLQTFHLQTFHRPLSKLRWQRAEASVAEAFLAEWTMPDLATGKARELDWSGNNMCFPLFSMFSVGAISGCIE